ncbi:P27 family phage terminase small subunit [Acinetobacter sp. A1]|uniref:P27 family phage terminase small subunit n=1 Tax=Acinetobacter sp. A1 TaxID=401467 RepID=UPI0014483127|nr:P27 family phage terminase small subunit [Acinetobacter sp. A1]
MAKTSSVTSKILKKSEIKVPAPLKITKEQKPFWDSIVEAKAPDLWTTADLIHAVTLAKTMQQIDRLQREIEAEGEVFTNTHGNPTLNPKLSLLDTAIKRSVSMCRLLQIHCIATVQSGQNAAKNTAHRKAQKAVEQTEDSDLLARPS